MAAVQTFAAGQRVTADGLNIAVEVGMVVYRAYRNAAQNITTGIDLIGNALVWDTVDLDRLNAGPSGGSTWTAPSAGWWTLAGSSSFTAATGGTLRDATWFINGVLISAGRARAVAASAGAIPNILLSAEMRTLPQLLNIGDTVQIVPSQDSGGTLTTTGGSLKPFISVTYSGPA